MSLTHLLALAISSDIPLSLINDWINLFPPNIHSGYRTWCFQALCLI